jgi:hypothetical protein
MNAGKPTRPARAILGPPVMWFGWTLRETLEEADERPIFAKRNTVH